MTFILMVIGAWVKANDAGLSCPDWPKCYGQYFPPFPSSENGGTWEGRTVAYTQAQILYEWAHRFLVSIIVIPVVALAITARTPEFRDSLRTLPMVAVGVLVFQALLGALTVVTGNPPWATTMHMATAVVWFGLFVATACLATFAPHAGPRKEPPSSTPALRFPGEEPHG
jgi:heme A synthase